MEHGYYPALTKEIKARSDPAPFMSARPATPASSLDDFAAASIRELEQRCSCGLPRNVTQLCMYDLQSDGKHSGSGIPFLRMNGSEGLRRVGGGPPPVPVFPCFRLCGKAGRV